MTEFLRISSSAHLILVPWILGWPDPGLTFDVVLHAGTLTAILSFFWKDGLQMVSGAFQADRNFQRSRPVMWFLIICGTAAVAGFFSSENERDDVAKLLHPVDNTDKELRCCLAR